MGSGDTGMVISDEVDRRPVALMTFAVLAVLGFIVTLILGARDAGSPARPRQPDADVAAGIQDELSGLPGVRAAEVSNTIECLNDCSQTHQNYVANVSLRSDVTPQEISAIVSTHDEIAPEEVGLAAVPITLALSPDKTLSVASVHYGFGVTQAEAYLAAVDASGGVRVAYGPPATGQSPLLTIEANLPGLVCGNADAAMSQVVPAVSAAAAAGGIPFSTVQFDCGTAKLEAGIAAGSAYQPGWTQVATSVDRVCRESACGETTGVVMDVAVSFQDSSTTVTVELNDGQYLSTASLETFHEIVDKLVAAGAANPQLDLKNY